MSKKNKYIINYDPNHDVVWFNINHISNNNVKIYLNDTLWSDISLIKSYKTPLNNSSQQEDISPSVLISLEIALNHLRDYNNSASIEKHIQYLLQWIKDQK